MKFAVAHPEKEMRAKIETCTRLLYAIEYHVVFYHPIIILAAERKKHARATILLRDIDTATALCFCSYRTPFRVVLRFSART